MPKSNREELGKKGTDSGALVAAPRRVGQISAMHERRVVRLCGTRRSAHPHEIEQHEHERRTSSRGAVTARPRVLET